MTTTNAPAPLLTVKTTAEIEALMRRANAERDSRLIGLCRAELNRRAGVR